MKGQHGFFYKARSHSAQITCVRDWSQIKGRGGGGATKREGGGACEVIPL